MSSTSHSSAGPGASTATEFVIEEFETEVVKERIEALVTTIEESVRQLRDEIVSDDRLEELLRSGPGSGVLKENDSSEHSNPEPTTKRVLIDPLFNALGYPKMATEVGDVSEEYGLQADYGLSLRDQPDIDSNRLLVEAEPLNKKLDQDSHGLGQVKDWLERDKFEADFGIATDGLRWILVKYDRDTYMFDRLGDIDLQSLFLAAFEDQTGRQVGLYEALDDTERDRVEDFIRTFALDNFLSIAGDAPSIIETTREDVTDEFYEEYVRIVFGVGGEDEAEPRARSLIGDGIVAPNEATGDDVRLFAVELMNRLIFLKFLEDRQLVREDLLRTVSETYNPETQPISLYKLYLEPLFFGVLNERPSDRSGQVERVGFYEGIPYLNGGLFTPRSGSDVEFDDRDFDVRDSVLGSIIDLLERYSFSAEGTPTELDPSILGNVFEKTINHITGESGDRKKSLGAYYTPDEITSFCAEKTVRPGLLERFQDTMVDELGRERVDMDRYDDVFDLIERAVPQDANVIEPLLEEVDQFRALDPACGSGHFLTSVQSEIVGIRKALYEKHPDDPPTWKLRKHTVVQNIYGVDIVSPAVEIAKLRLWLSIIGKVEPDAMERYDEDELALPNVVFNVKQGNSLIGYTGLVETNDEHENGHAQAPLDAWGPESVQAKYGEIIALIRRHREATDRREAGEYLQRAEALLSDYREELDPKVLTGFQRAGVEDITLEQVREYEPFHWVLEFADVYADGGFDVVVGNPPWDQLRPSRDDFFSRYDERFRTRAQSEKDEVQAELLEDDTIAAGWEEHQERMRIRAKYFNDSPAYELQNPTVAGRGVASENELSSLFLERTFAIVRKGAYTAQVLPGVIFTGASTKDLRMKLLTESEIDTIVGFENRGIFDQIDIRYRFGVVSFRSGGETGVLRGLFLQHDVGILENGNDFTVEIPRRVLSEFSPEARIFPSITSQGQADVLNQLLTHPSLAKNENRKWKAKALREELHSARDSDRFFESKTDGEYPVYGGSNIYQYLYNASLSALTEPPKYWSVEEDVNPKRSAKRRVRQKRFNSGDLKKRIYTGFGGESTSKSQKSFVNDLLNEHRGNPLNIEDIRLDCTEYRIAYRDITNATNERTMIATVLPKGIVCEDTLQTIRPFRISIEEKHLSESSLQNAYQRIFSDEELFVALGLLNSLPFDFIMRMKVETHIAKYKFEESQMPRLTAGDEWFEYIWRRTARLNCYGEAFAEMRERLGGIDPAIDESERQRLQAEIDAAAFHAYGLDRDETEFVLDDFHRVQNPRLMTEDYFELVSEKYDKLEATKLSLK